MVFYNEKIEGLERLPDEVGFVPNLKFNVEKFVFYSFWNPSMRTHARVHIRMHKACIHKSRACVHIHVSANACPRILWPSFPKIDLFSS